MKKDKLQKIVEAYKVNPSPQLKRKVLEEATPLIKHIISKIHMPSSPLISWEDLKSSAVIGLFQALDSYELSKGIKFNTFCYYRIHGGAVDYIRNVDVLTREERKDYALIYKAKEKKAQDLGREPGDREVADEAGFSLDYYYNVLIASGSRNNIGFEETFEREEFEDFFDDLGNSLYGKPDKQIEEEELLKILKFEINKLPPRERYIMKSYFYKRVFLHDIGDVLGISEARTSQLVKKSVRKIKHIIKHNYNYEIA